MVIPAFTTVRLVFTRSAAHIVSITQTFVLHQGNKCNGILITFQAKAFSEGLC